MLALLTAPKGVGVSEVQTRPKTFPPTFKQSRSDKVYLMLQLKAKTLCNAPNKFAWARVIPTLSDCSIVLPFLMLTLDIISYIFRNCDRREGDGRDGPTSTPEPERLGKPIEGPSPGSWGQGDKSSMRGWELARLRHSFPKAMSQTPKKLSSKSLVHFSKHGGFIFSFAGFFDVSTLHF